MLLTDSVVAMSPASFSTQSTSFSISDPAMSLLVSWQDVSQMIQPGFVVFTVSLILFQHLSIAFLRNCSSSSGVIFSFPGKGCPINSPYITCSQSIHFKGG